VALALLVVVSPLVAGAVLLVSLRAVLSLDISNDLRLSREELPFVADAFLVAAAVFVSLAIVGAVGDLASAGRSRILFLTFQPLVSLSYAGRLAVLRSQSESRVRRWPWVMLLTTALYSIVGFIGLRTVGRHWLTSELWQFSNATFVVFAVGQCGRSYHQGVADVRRRFGSEGLVLARVVFAVLAGVLTAPLVIVHGLFGFSLAMCISFVLAAVVVDRSTSWRSAEAIGWQP
jgi:hypothetical protein